MLRDHLWIQTVNLGGAKSGVQAYIVNSRVAWQGSRDGIRHSVFDATVYATEQEQEPDAIEEKTPLHRLPALYPDEMQIPSGDGLPPVSQPSLPGMEQELPARRISSADNSQSDQFPEFPSLGVENWTREELENFARRASGNSTREEFSERKIGNAGEGEIEE